MSSDVLELETKGEVDRAILSTEDRVAVLRFGRASDEACARVDEVMRQAAPALRRMARVFTVDVDKVPEYTRYFDVTLIPATVFYFNAHHMKVNAKCVLRRPRRASPLLTPARQHAGPLQVHRRL